MKFQRKEKNTKSKAAGVTMMELLIVIAIIGILLGVAVPLSIGMLGRTKSDAYINKVQSLLQLTRSTAMAQGKSVIICPTSTGDSCDTSITSNNWGNTRVLSFISNNGDAVYDPGDEIISTLNAPAVGGYLSETGGLKYIEFQANGFAARALSIGYCSYVGTSGSISSDQQLAISRFGSIRLDTAPTNPVSC